MGEGQSPPGRRQDRAGRRCGEEGDRRRGRVMTALPGDTTLPSDYRYPIDAPGRAQSRLAVFGEGNMPEKPAPDAIPVPDKPEMPSTPPTDFPEIPKPKPPQSPFPAHPEPSPGQAPPSPPATPAED